MAKHKSFFIKQTGKITLFILIHIYSKIMVIISVLFSVVALFSTNSGRWHLKERGKKKLISDKELSIKKVWVHCASMGEAKVAKRFIAELNKSCGNNFYIITIMSESGYDFLKQKLPENTELHFFPIDRISIMNWFVKVNRISQLWITETELWPAMLYSCHKNRVPVAIYNGRIEHSSFKFYSALSLLFSPLLNTVSLVIAQSNEYADRFISLGVQKDRVKIRGNIKSAVEIIRVSKESRKKNREELGIKNSEIVILFSCFHPDEIDTVKDTVNEFSSSTTSYKFIIAPRHIEKTDSIIAQFDEVDKPIKLKTLQYESSWHIAVVEAFGLLSELYKASDIVVMGGTFNNIGGHNIWEPMSYSLPVFSGPNYFTQKKSYETLQNAKVAFISKDSTTLIKSIKVFQKSDFENNISLYATSVTEKKYILNEEIALLNEVVDV